MFIYEIWQPLLEVLRSQRRAGFVFFFYRSPLKYIVEICEYNIPHGLLCADKCCFYIRDLACLIYLGKTIIKYPVSVVKIVVLLYTYEDGSISSSSNTEMAPADLRQVAFKKILILKIKILEGRRREPTNASGKAQKDSKFQ